VNPGHGQVKKPGVKAQIKPVKFGIDRSFYIDIVGAINCFFFFDREPVL